MTCALLPGCVNSYHNIKCPQSRYYTPPVNDTIPYDVAHVRRLAARMMVGLLLSETDEHRFGTKVYLEAVGALRDVFGPDVEDRIGDHVTGVHMTPLECAEWVAADWDGFVAVASGTHTDPALDGSAT